MTAYRRIAPLLFALLLVHIAVGALLVAVPLALTEQGAGALAVGLVAASYAVGVVFGLHVAPQITATLGPLRAFTVFAALSAVASLALSAAGPALAWDVLRAVAGFCLAGALTAGETAVAGEVDRQPRGHLLLVYAVLAVFGLVIGPFLAPHADVSLGGFMVAGGALALSVVFTAAGELPKCKKVMLKPLSLGALARLAPAGVAGGLASGAIIVAVLSLSAVFVSRRMADETGQDIASAAASLNGAIWIGGLLAALPIGWLSDRMDRRWVMALAATVAAIVAFMFPIFSEGAMALADDGGMSIMVFLAALWGAAAFSVYFTAVAHVVDRAPNEQVLAAIAGMIAMWAFGAVLGPAIGGIAMAIPLIGSAGLFWLAAAGHVLLALFAFRQRAREADAAVEPVHPLAIALPTSFAIGRLDPRVDAQLVSAEAAPHAPEPDIIDVEQYEREAKQAWSELDEQETDRQSQASHTDGGSDHEGEASEEDDGTRSNNPSPS